MSDDFNKTDETAGAGSKPAGGHEDLKAKLGLRIPERKPAAEQSSAPAQDAGKVETAQPVERRAVPVEDIDFDEEPAGKGGVSGGVIGVIIAIALVMAVIGLFVGGVFKGRAIENHKINEAQHLLEYFTTATVAATGGATILDTVKAHIEDTKRVFEAMNKAQSPEEVDKARAELEAYIVRCQKYRDIQPFFTVKNAFYDVLFNSEMANETVVFIDAVRRLYGETVLFALEADTRKQVATLEDTSAAKPSIMFIEPFSKENGERWNKGVWISQLDAENPIKTASGTDYAMIAMVSGEAFRASTTSLVEFDMAPVALQKSLIHNNAIVARVQGRLGQMIAVINDIDFDSLEAKLKEVAARTPYFTFF
ncbi:MAG TPA: hypothetical protein PLB35_01625 [Myxococcota bacterium]|nr:hypothetical protein [Myxococcota bacterium]HOA12946.1 hypothetical protein [Myxococcota bacterium]HOH75933.1 hypothetical protein [Myxococcota bacterium]HPV03169.1 hypothetical protein [Myxococcota bacterium]